MIDYEHSFVRLTHYRMEGPVFEPQWWHVIFSSQNTVRTSTMVHPASSDECQNFPQT